VHKLWGESSSLTSVAVASPAPANQTSSGSASQGLDLFSDRSGTFSS
jgi:hypothetical protein